MHSASLVIFYLVCPRRRRRRACGPPDESCNSPPSPGIRFGEDHQRRARNHSNLQTNKMLFWAWEDLVQMSLEALVIVATAVEAHGLSFEKRLRQHTSAARVKCETYTPWNIGCLDTNARSPWSTGISFQCDVSPLFQVIPYLAPCLLKCLVKNV